MHRRLVEKSISFIRAWEKLTASARTTSSGLLAVAQDCGLKVDLRKQLKLLQSSYGLEEESHG